MAIRRLNYTGRKRLRRADARITIYDTGEGVATFDADLSLDRYNLPEDALVFVEAQRQTSWMRFPFGSVGALRAPGDRRLAEFDSPEGVLFRVRVTSRSDPHGMEVAEADRIRPRRPEEVEDKRVPLLSVKPDQDLEGQVFRVDFSDRPILLVNSRVGDWRAVAKQPAFVSLVFAAALREILTRILRVEEHFDAEESEDWRSQWLRYATLLPGMTHPPTQADDDLIDRWIDEAVASFCRRHRMMERFRQYWTRETD